MDAPTREIRILEEVEELLRDSACLHYALSELAAEPNLKASAARASMVRVGFCAHLRGRHAELAVPPPILNDCVEAAPDRLKALQSLVHANIADAQRHIGASDASMVERIRRRLNAPNLSAATVNLLRLLVTLLLDERSPQ